MGLLKYKRKNSICASLSYRFNPSGGGGGCGGGGGGLRGVVIACFSLKKEKRSTRAQWKTILFKYLTR